MEILPFLVLPFLASLILTGIHAYLGVHVVERGVIFVDLALAQIAALGATIAILAGMDPHGTSAYWISLAFTFMGALIFSFVRSATARISTGFTTSLPGAPSSAHWWPPRRPMGVGCRGQQALLRYWAWPPSCRS